MMLALPRLKRWLGPGSWCDSQDGGGGRDSKKWAAEPCEWGKNLKALLTAGKLGAWWKDGVRCSERAQCGAQYSVNEASSELRVYHGARFLLSHCTSACSGKYHSQPCCTLDCQCNQLLHTASNVPWSMISINLCYQFMPWVRKMCVCVCGDRERERACVRAHSFAWRSQRY